MKTTGMIPSQVAVDETDLFVVGEVDLCDVATKATHEARRVIKAFIIEYPMFETTHNPYDVRESAPAIVKHMAAAAAAAGVGPMAAVAGAIAEYVGRACLKDSPQVIVENGGDIFIVSNSPRRMAIYAGKSPLSERLVLIIKPAQTPLGVCTSSGTVGHSFSYGTADAAVAMSPDAALADAWATQLGNLVHSQEDLEKAIEAAKNAAGLTGAVIIKDDKMAAWGDIELEPLK